MTSTQRLRERQAELLAVLRSTANRAWRAWADAPALTSNDVATRARTSSDRIDRLRFYIATGRDAAYNGLPPALMKLTAGEWGARYKAEYEAWVAAGRKWVARGVGASASAGPPAPGGAAGGGRGPRAGRGS